MPEPNGWRYALRGKVGENKAGTVLADLCYHRRQYLNFILFELDRKEDEGLKSGCSCQLETNVGLTQFPIDERLLQILTFACDAHTVYPIRPMQDHRIAFLCTDFLYFYPRTPKRIGRFLLLPVEMLQAFHKMLPEIHRNNQ